MLSKNVPYLSHWEKYDPLLVTDKYITSWFDKNRRTIVEINKYNSCHLIKLKIVTSENDVILPKKDGIMPENNAITTEIDGLMTLNYAIMAQIFKKKRRKWWSTDQINVILVENAIADENSYLKAATDGKNSENKRNKVISMMHGKSPPSERILEIIKSNNTLCL